MQTTPGSPATSSSTGTTTGSTGGTPVQQSVALALREALALCVTSHAPVVDTTTHAGTTASGIRWGVVSSPSPTGAALALARGISKGAVDRERMRALLARCLVHYRTALAPGSLEDDAAAALACFLAAVVQAVEGHAVTPERWDGIRQWLTTWVDLPPKWASAPLADKQDFFERMAILAVAVGEWSVQASLQTATPTAMASARVMAQRALQQELGLDAGALLAAMRHLAIVPASAADPSWGEAELPKAPTSTPPRHGL